MKKNAIIVASILFVAAGCAHQGSSGRAGMETGSDTSLSAHGQTFSTEQMERHPDGSIRTPAADIQNQNDISADSSVRGGTLQARGVEPYHSSLKSAESTRETFGVPDDQSGIVTNEDSLDASITGQGSSAEMESAEVSGTIRNNWNPAGDPNWNPSDDLMRDGLSGDEAMLEGTESANAHTAPPPWIEGEQGSDTERTADSDLYLEQEVGIGSAAESESGTGRSSEMDDNPAPDLNTSPKLEENISGEYQLEEDKSSDTVQPQVGVTGNEPEWLFKNNRAQGVGSAATGEFGVAHSRDPLAQNGELDKQLEQRVKRGFLLESPGLRSVMSHDVARNIEVSARNGVVTLKGSVPTESDRKLAEIRAAETAGVKRVDNQLSIAPAADPVNREIGTGHDLENRIDLLQD